MPGEPQRYGPPGRTTGHGELAGIGLELFTQRLAGTGRVCGVQFRPGGFRPFAPDRPVSAWTGRRLPYGTAAEAAAVLGPDDEDRRVAALDALLLARGPHPAPQARQAMELARRIRTDRTVRRVSALARDAGLPVRTLQRFFADWVGGPPKWVVLRHRLHDALERAGRPDGVDWAALAAELGYSDQAHLVRDFTATIGVSPAAYASSSATTAKWSEGHTPSTGPSPARRTDRTRPVPSAAGSPVWM
ncbi:helix-turn-helix domain-containing protein [Streptomyces sp. AA0539]|uniref:helix-turn-helix domain-containing protein n=1 Tax=Streptomyces sp. AA0539 TaxID=1210045 RepID=UPI00036CF847